jgi:F420-dependent oxidoreductase-like protein
MAQDVWFGLHTAPEGFDFDFMSHLAKEAEKAGLNTFTITDHFMNMANPDGAKGHPLECWTTLAGLASVTNKIKLGPLVSCYAYREPTVLAKMATTFDIMSKGRLIMGIGAGWHETEFKGYIGEFPSAGERLTGLEETVNICKSMFTNERTTFQGKMYKINNVLNSPQPIQKPIPILIGGGGEKRTLKIVARHADISHFVSTGQDFDGLLRKLDLLRKYCGSVNRDFDEIRKGTWFFPFIGRTDDEAKNKVKSMEEMAGVPPGTLLNIYEGTVGTPDKVAAAVQRYIDVGFGLITFLGIFTNEDLQLLSNEVIPQLKI